MYHEPDRYQLEGKRAPADSGKRHDSALHEKLDRRCSPESKNSEYEFRPELNHARCVGLGNLPKRAAPGVTYGWILPVCLVEGVKCIPLDLHTHAFSPRQSEGLLGREVPSVSMRPDEVVDGRVARAERRFSHKRVWIEPAQCLCVRACPAKPKRLAWNDLRSPSDVNATKANVDAICCSERRAGLVVHYAAERPPFHKSAFQASHTFAPRRFEDEADCQDIRRVIAQLAIVILLPSLHHSASLSPAGAGRGSAIHQDRIRGCAHEAGVRAFLFGVFVV